MCNLVMGDFCKKSRNRSIIVFPCPHFDAYLIYFKFLAKHVSPRRAFSKWFLNDFFIDYWFLKSLVVEEAPSVSLVLKSAVRRRAQNEVTSPLEENG
jgi:hypothetical protein